jgi:hypothetical protein
MDAKFSVLGQLSEIIVRAQTLPSPSLFFRAMLAGAAALSVGCSPASAQDRETWRCDAPNGHYDRNAPSIWDKTTSITGRINFHEAHAGPDGSIARIAFSDSKLDDGDCHCNGLYLEGFHDPERVGFYLLVDGEPELVSSRKYEIPITFKFSIDPAGVITLQVGKEEVHVRSAKLPHPQRDTMVMSCSGADVSFLNVDPQ